MLTGDPAGERFVPGAFTRTLRGRATRIPLLVNHERGRVFGYSTRMDDSDTELVGTFQVNEGRDGDKLLADLRDGYYGGLSVGMLVANVGRATTGEREVRQAHLVETSIVGVPAYSESKVLAMRNAQLPARFRNPRPTVDLSPIPSFRR